MDRHDECMKCPDCGNDIEIEHDSEMGSDNMYIYIVFSSFNCKCGYYKEIM
jgi:hypothetical protein